MFSHRMFCRSNSTNSSSTWKGNHIGWALCIPTSLLYLVFMDPWKHSPFHKFFYIFFHLPKSGNPRHIALNMNCLVWRTNIQSKEIQIILITIETSLIMSRLIKLKKNLCINICNTVVYVIITIIHYSRIIFSHKKLISIHHCCVTPLPEVLKRPGLFFWLNDFATPNYCFAT